MGPGEAGRLPFPQVEGGARRDRVGVGRPPRRQRARRASGQGRLQTGGVDAIVRHGAIIPPPPAGGVVGSFSQRPRERPATELANRMDAPMNSAPPRPIDPIAAPLRPPLRAFLPAAGPNRRPTWRCRRRLQGAGSAAPRPHVTSSPCQRPPPISVPPLALSRRVALLEMFPSLEAIRRRPPPRRPLDGARRAAGFPQWFPAGRGRSPGPSSLGCVGIVAPGTSPRLSSPPGRLLPPPSPRNRRALVKLLEFTPATAALRGAAWLCRPASPPTGFCAVVSWRR